jgi:uncharacterized SAM-binding protein YcdF (DUF218 family)
MSTLPRSSRGRAALIAIGLAILLVAAWAATFAGTVLVVERPIASPDAIVSLASHEWERLPEASRLAHRYPNAQVILTLPAVITEYTCHDCDTRVDQLVRIGVAKERIHVVPVALLGTFAEALALRAYAQHERIAHVLVVTSPYHTRRALATFQKAFEGTRIDIGIQPALATSPVHPEAWWRSRLDRWYVRYEWEAAVYYFVRYQINVFNL